MKRRRFLGVAGAAALGGCGGRAVPGPADEPSPSGGDPTAWGCPGPVDAERAVCPGDDGAPLAVERSTGTTAGGAWTLLASATNASDEPYRCDPHAWSVLRRDGRRWVRVSPAVSVDPGAELRPGEAYTWLLSAPGGADATGPAPRRGGSGAPAVAADADQHVHLALEPSRYAFVVPFGDPERLAAVVPFATEREPRPDADGT